MRESRQRREGEDILRLRDSNRACKDWSGRKDEAEWRGRRHGIPYAAKPPNTNRYPGLPVELRLQHKKQTRDCLERKKLKDKRRSLILLYCDWSMQEMTCHKRALIDKHVHEFFHTNGEEAANVINQWLSLPVYRARMTYDCRLTLTLYMGKRDRAHFYERQAWDTRIRQNNTK